VCLLPGTTHATYLASVCNASHLRLSLTAHHCLWSCQSAQRSMACGSVPPSSWQKLAEHSTFKCGPSAAATKYKTAQNRLSSGGHQLDRKELPPLTYRKDPWTNISTRASCFNIQENTCVICITNIQKVHYGTPPTLSSWRQSTAATSPELAMRGSTSFGLVEGHSRYSLLKRLYG
jgi:hypothetical protein